MDAESQQGRETMTTTTETLTGEQIEALRIDAGTHGDTTLVETCRRAEDGDEKSRATVARILAETETEEAEPTAYGMTFAAWLAAAGRSDSASEYDLRAAWRAGEAPTDYQREAQ